MFFAIMAYLRSRDYDKQIQADNLAQITSSDLGVKLLAEATAEEECSSYLVQKYDISKEFNGILVFSPTFAYDAEQLIELNYSLYSTTVAYQTNDLISNNNLCYICANNTTGIFNPSSWIFIGNQFDLFYAKTPQPLFNLEGVYNIGDKVYFKGNTYTCVIPTFLLNHNGLLQLGEYKNVPYQNVFPNDPINGRQYWGVPTSYIVTAGTLPTDLRAWIKGDNRSQQLLMCAIDIALYHVHSRIAPRNIPQIRQDRYNNAIDWLIKANTGTVTAKLPRIQPIQGRVVRFGGNIKNINTY